MRSQLSDFFRRCRTRILRLRCNYALSQREKDIRNLADGLVTHGAENKSERTIFIESGKRGTQCPRARWVVRNVEHDLRNLAGARYHLKPGWPPRHTYALFNMVRRYPEPAMVELLRRGNGQSQIAQLVPACKREINLDLFSHHR